MSNFAAMPARKSGIAFGLQLVLVQARYSKKHFSSQLIIQDEPARGFNGTRQAIDHSRLFGRWRSRLNRHLASATISSATALHGEEIIVIRRNGICTPELHKRRHLRDSCTGYK